MNVFFRTEQALKNPNAPLLIFETGLAGEADRPPSLLAVLKYSNTPLSMHSSQTSILSPATSGGSEFVVMNE